VTLIATQGLTKRFPRVTALDDLTVEVPPGVTGLVGANGAGKSTLIKIFLGLLAPTSGSASVLDLDIATQGPQIRARVGYMPEHDCLPPDMSATELIVHLAQVSGLPMKAARERAADVLRHVGLAEERYRAIGTYSTGMRQRVKLAQAIVHDPELVFLDEPTNGLDPLGRDDMLRLIRRIGTDFGIAVLVTSHLLGELERSADHVIVLDAGRMLRSSSTAEFTEATGVLTVEVQDPAGGNPREVLGQALRESGLRVVHDGALLQIEINDESTYDRVRDVTAELGLGLVRLQQARRRIEDIFRDDAAVGGPR
jgi:ABC-2 type transport system ATP-binding protein